MKAIEIENVTKTFGSLSAVDDLTLTVEEGSIYGFIGPNGSGKTTTLRMIMNIIYPDRGTIRLLGRASNGARLERGSIAVPSGQSCGSPRWAWWSLPS